MVGKGDLGAGGSHFTWQLVGGFAYQIAEKFAVVGGYRAIHIDYDRDNFLFDTTVLWTTNRGRAHWGQLGRSPDLKTLHQTFFHSWE